MNLEDFLNKKNIIDLSFFNFRNAITAAYFADTELNILRVNDNFKKFFPVLGNLTNAYFPDVLSQLGIPGQQIDDFIYGIKNDGFVQIPEIRIRINEKDRIYSLLSTCTKDAGFSYLNSIQGQFLDRTDEWLLRKEREELLDQKLRHQQIIEEKSQRLENLSKQLAKYLSPQIYRTIFSDTEGTSGTISRKNLTVFFSDIVRFTDLTDVLEPERLAAIINTYLSEMASIALDCGGTIDKFIGDAILVFFGDPESNGETEDALNCVEMALRMQQRVSELQESWKRQGVPQGIQIRMGIATGHCTVGNFGSEQRLDYTAVGRPVNLAARLQGLADPSTIVVDQNTYHLINDHVICENAGEIIPKGMARAVQLYKISDFLSNDHRQKRQKLSKSGKYVEVNVISTSDMRAVIEELAQIQKDFEKQISS